MPDSKNNIRSSQNDIPLEEIFEKFFGDQSGKAGTSPNGGRDGTAGNETAGKAFEQKLQEAYGGGSSGVRPMKIAASILVVVGGSTFPAEPPVTVEQ